MIKLNRVCIVFGLDCNLHCRYCYRDIHKLDEIPEITDDFKNYLQSLDPSWCTAVCASGGEPLLYLDKIIEAFSYVPKRIHKKIMTNGVLLTRDIVDYINANQIELHFSHDGETTKFLRGVDVLDDARIRNLIRQVNILRVVSVITNRNCDMIRNYAYIHKLLDRDDMIYSPSAVFDTGANDDLIKQFDYDLYAKTYMEYCIKHARNTPYYVSYGRSNGFNVLLDGTVVGMSTMSRYGTIHDPMESLRRAKDDHEESRFCKTANCTIKKDCLAMTQTASTHVCRIQKIHHDIFAYFERNRRDVHGI